ncbi:MAG: phospholipase D-like domain-containing protein [Sarcina sp.]
MKLTDYSINCLAKIIAGDTFPNETIYRGGRQLVEFFWKYGFRDIYSSQFPTRWVYVKEKLMELNETKKLEKVFIDVVDTRHFIGLEFNNSKTLEAINEIIKYDSFEIKQNSDSMYYIEGDILEEKEVEVEVSFEEIQDKLISELQNAKYIILVAVAWFTNKKIYNVLKAKQAEGVVVRVIISNDDTNNGSGLDYSIFDTYKMSKFGQYKYNIMHNKFCVIDLKKVLEGSYNWTNSAEYHKEQFMTISSFEQGGIFADRFMELRSEILHMEDIFNF